MARCSAVFKAERLYSGDEVSGGEVEELIGAVEERAYSRDEVEALIAEALEHAATNHNPCRAL